MQKMLSQWGKSRLPRHRHERGVGVFCKQGPQREQVHEGHHQPARGPFHRERDSGFLLTTKGKLKKNYHLPSSHPLPTLDTTGIAFPVTFEQYKISGNLHHDCNGLIRNAAAPRRLQWQKCCRSPRGGSEQPVMWQQAASPRAASPRQGQCTRPQERQIDGPVTRPCRRSLRVAGPGQ